MGLVERPWSTDRRGNPPLFLYARLYRKEKVLSCFIDESGDFGSYDHKAPYYLVIMVLHDQNRDIRNAVKVMDYQEFSEKLL